MAAGDEPAVDAAEPGSQVPGSSASASVAAAGEILVSAETARAAGLEGGLGRRAVELKGKAEPVEVLPIVVGPMAERIAG